MLCLNTGEPDPQQDNKQQQANVKKKGYRRQLVIKKRESA